MDDPARQQAFGPGWLPQTPIPGVSLSAGGLLALADLSTVAQRTALTGGSSWLDSLVLVPGLHYQQAADELARRAGLAPALSAYELRPDGSRVPYSINNAAVTQYCQRVARDSELVMLDVGLRLPRGRRGGAGKTRIGSSLGMAGGRNRRLGPGATGAGGVEAARCEADDDLDELVLADIGWLSHLLYLISPLLTIAAIVLLVLINDWWALGCVCALMFSRILNIWVIKQRAARKEAPHTPAAPPLRHPSTTSTAATISTSSSTTAGSQRHRQQRRRGRQQAAMAGHHHHHHHHHHSTSPPPASASADDFGAALISLLVAVPGGREVCLRGTAADLAAVAGSAWLRAQTHVEGYLEAAAKLCVYLVAAVSGNWTQAGALVVMVLFLASAALLALSNAHAKKLDVAGGYVAVPGGRPRRDGAGRAVVVEPAMGSGGGEAGGGFEAAVHNSGVMDQQTLGRDDAAVSSSFVVGQGGGGRASNDGWPTITAESSDTGALYDGVERGQSPAVYKDGGATEAHNQGS